MICRTCRGPAGAGYARCYQCDLARSEAGGLLADVVAPLAYAVRGGPLADDLYRYKSPGVPAANAAAAAGRLGAALGAFLAGRGPALWRAAGMAAGPAAVTVVPSGRGRLGGHPLERITQSALNAAGAGLPLVPLVVRPGAVHRRGVNPAWVRVAGRVAGADLLVVDDTWVSGGSAQSAAAALKRAGASRVAVVVLGRHVNPADPRSADFLARLSRRVPPARHEGETMNSEGHGEDCHAVRATHLHPPGRGRGAQPGRAGSGQR